MENLTIEEIKQMLKDLKISQPKMAKSIFVSKDYINQILNGRKDLTARMHTKMVVFLTREQLKQKKV